MVLADLIQVWLELRAKVKLRVHHKYFAAQALPLVRFVVNAHHVDIIVKAVDFRKKDVLLQRSQRVPGASQSQQKVKVFVLPFELC